MSVEVVPFEGAGCGAEIRGVDIREPLSAADRDAIRKAWLDNLVLRFRGMPMTDAQHMAFTRQFGELEFNPAKLIEKQYGVETQTAGRKSEIPPEISVISNIIEDGKAIGGLGSYELVWHTDMSYNPLPPRASLLYALEVPPDGGNTGFLNMYTAYETLAGTLKRAIEGKTCIHDSSRNSAGELRKGFQTTHDVSKTPGAVHPLVRRHPVTGRNALFLGRRPGAYIHGMSVEDSENLLDAVWAHATQPHFAWYQKWRIGDLVLWDNRCVMHRRDAFDEGLRRLMHRTQIVGEPVMAG